MSVDFNIQGMRADEPVNFGNVNARQVLDLLGVSCDPYLWGEIPVSDMDAVIRRAMIIVNVPRADLGTPASVTSESGHATLVICEVTDESVRTRVRRVMDLCVRARRLGCSVLFG